MAARQSQETCCCSALGKLTGKPARKDPEVSPEPAIMYVKPGLCYRARTSSRALRALLSLPQEKVDTFLKSYEIFELEKIRGEADGAKIVNYYEVLNHLCAVGEVEKMYIPAVIDPKVGIFGNQVLFEEKMAKDIGAKAGMRVLDMGCGRGRIAHHVATLTGAHVTGINIDSNQIASAKEYAGLCGLLGKQLDFQVHNFNEPLPFADQSFDAMYNVQAFTYAKDMVALFKEINRVLKPGAKISILDWVKLDKYDEKNELHRDLLARVKPLIGAVYTPAPRDFEEAMRAAGLEVLQSQDASVGGHQYPLIEFAKNFFEPLQGFVKGLCKARILPRHLNVLFERFTKDGDAFVEADKLGIFTTSWQVVAQKPLA